MEGPGTLPGITLEAVFLTDCFSPVIFWQDECEQIQLNLWSVCHMHTLSTSPATIIPPGLENSCLMCLIRKEAIGNISNMQRNFQTKVNNLHIPFHLGCGRGTWGIGHIYIYSLSRYLKITKQKVIFYFLKVKEYTCYFGEILSIHYITIKGMKKGNNENPSKIFMDIIVQVLENTEWKQSL